MLPDPAEQFSNPYLGIGNNPVMYVDPDGEFAFLIPVAAKMIAGAAIGGASYTLQTTFGNTKWSAKQLNRSLLFGGISGGMSYGIGGLGLAGLESSVIHGIGQGVLSELRGGDFQTGLATGIVSSFVSSSLLEGGGNFGESTFGNLALSGLSGGIVSKTSGGNFWQGFGTGVTISGLNHLSHKASTSGPGDPPKKDNNDESKTSESDREEPLVPGPYEDGTSWDNIKAHAATMDRRYKGANGLNNLGKDFYNIAYKAGTTSYQVLRMLGSRITTIIPFAEFQKILIDDFSNPQYPIQN